MTREESGEAPRVPAITAARELAARLQEAGFRTLFAGGCVRDRLMGLGQSVDIDIATAATPDAIKQLFPKARGVGEAFGVMRVRHRGHTFEVATFRKDGPYHDGRRPSSVTYSDELEDAARRDFTVNGIFQDPVTGIPVDYVKGAVDIKAKLIRAIGDPSARIAEDRLRLLRAVRFAARLGFQIEEQTSAAMRLHARELLSVSCERVGEEVRKMLVHANRARAATLVESHGLDGAIFGALGTSGGSLPRLTRLSATTAWTTALTAWILDRLAGDLQEPDASTPRPDSHVRLVATETVRASLCLSNHDADAILQALESREALLAGFDALPRAARVRHMARPQFDTALEMLDAESCLDSGRWRVEADRELPTRALPIPLIDGNALVADGLRPGPRFKHLLDLALDAQIEGRVHSRAEALELVRAANRAKADLEQA